MSPEKLKESIQNWKSIVDTNAFADSVTAFAGSAASVSPIIDKVSTWAAAGTATVAGLTITNIDKMANVYEPFEVKRLFSCLALSMAFAIIQKYLSLTCSASLHVAEEMKKRFPPVLETFGKSEKKIKEISDNHKLGIEAEYDFSKVCQAFLELLPKWAQFFIRPRFTKSIENRIYSHKSTMSALATQHLAVFIQYILIFMFICLAAIFM